MSASSSVAPQVFINFRGKDVRNGFISFLDAAMREANINVFVDEDEVVGTNLANLFVRIQESRVAVVIFSKDYTNSEWCLDELAQIKDCIDQGGLNVIPIFYKLAPATVRELRGDFGDIFRALKRRYLHEPERTRKWEEALESIPKVKGMTFSEERNEPEFIYYAVMEIQRMLSQIAVKGNPKTESNSQGGVLVPARRVDIAHSDNPEKWTWSAIYDRPYGQIQQPDANRQGCVFNVRELKISSWDKARYWAFESISESPNGAVIEVAKMQEHCYYLEVSKKFDTSELTSGTRYEVVFVVKVEDTMTRWDYPAKVQLMVPRNSLQEREFQFVDLRKNEWIDIQAGVFEARPHNEEIAFYLYQYEPVRMKGLVVKCAIIRPVE